MRGLLSKAHPGFGRVLVVESGPREATEQFLRQLYERQRSPHVDLLTCFEHQPAAFDGMRGTVYSIHDPAVSRNRAGFLWKLLRARYTIVAILCTGSAVLQKWKWVVALSTQAKLVIVNEHGGYFVLDYWHRQAARAMFAQRVRLRRSQRLQVPVDVLPELFLVPFTIAYLLLYAGAVHARRLIKAVSGRD